MRAIEPNFLQEDRSVSGEKFSLLNRTGAGSAAIGTGLGFVGRLCLLGGDLLAQGPSDLLTELVSALLDRGEVEGGGRNVPLEQVAGEKGEKLLELGILRSLGR